MSKRGTLALLGILVALCAAYALMLHVEARHKLRVAESRKIFSFPPSEIASVQVQRIGETPVVGERAPGAVWSITQPNPDIEPNQVVWDRLVNAVAGLSNPRTIDSEGKDPAQYGLDKPVLTITAKKADGSSVVLTCGALEPTQKYRYAAATGTGSDAGGTRDGAIFLVDTKTFNEMDRPLSLLRYPYVINVGNEGIRRIEFAYYWTGVQKPDSVKTKEADTKRAVGEESVVVSLERNGNSPWRMTSPEQTAANQELVEAIVKEVQFATGRDYIDAPKNLADYGLEPPKARITIYSGNKSPETLYLGSQESKGGKQKPGGLFVKRKERPAVFVMDDNIFTMMPKSPDAFRESRLFSGMAGGVDMLHYVAGKTDMIFQNSAEQGWKIVQPAVDDTDQVAVSGFLALLKAVQGEGFPGAPQPQFGLDNPAVAITLNFKKAATDHEAPAPRTIKLGAKVPDADKFYAMQDNGVVTIIGAFAANALTKTVYDFRQMSFLGFNKNDASRVTLEFEGKNYRFEKPRGQWAITDPTGKAFTSPNDVEVLLQSLSGLRATGVEVEKAPADLSVYGLDAPLATITVTALRGAKVEAQMVLGPLKIGKTTPDDSQMRFAMIPKYPGVYRIRQAVVDDIRETLKNIH